MGDRSKIEWTEASWNPIAGCSVLSPGCTNCYAMRQAGGRLRSTAKFAGLTRPTKVGPVWTGVMRFWEKALEQPLRWKDPHRIFVNSMSDLFHESVPTEWIDRIFAIMALCPQHQFQVLTKRAEQMRDYISGMKSLFAGGIPERLADIALTIPSAPPNIIDRWPLPNLHLGVSVEDQQRADERIPVLLDTPAAVRWISAEPLLGPVDLMTITVKARGMTHIFPSLTTTGFGNPPLDWVVIGGESGPHARPFSMEWARSIITQCREAQTPVFMKQVGRWAGEVKDGVWHNRLYAHKGGAMDEWPADLRVREYPR